MATAAEILAAAEELFKATPARGIAHGDKRLDVASAREIRDRISLAQELTQPDEDEILSAEVATL